MIQEPSESRINTEDSALQELRQYFPKEHDEQLDRWLNLRERIKNLNELIPSLPISSDETREKILDELGRALRRLNEKRPYIISVIGPIGSGKSALLNALLGEYLLPSIHSSKAVTGTVVKVCRRRAQDGEPGSEQVTFYFDLNKLAKRVEEACRTLFAEPSFADQNGSGHLNMEETRAAVENSPTQDQEKLKADTIAMLDAMEAYREELKEGKSTWSLDSEKKRDKFQDYINEESPLNKKRRVALIIDRVEVDIIVEGADEESLPDVELTDVPGSRASVEHKEMLKEQLDPSKTDAVVLVVAATERYQLDVQELAPLIQDVIMGELSGEDRLRAARRIFFVVNKAIESSAGSQKYEDDITTAVETIYGPGFLEKYGTENIHPVSALPSLIAQLLLKPDNLDDAQRWLREETDTSFEPFAPNEKSNADPEGDVPRITSAKWYKNLRGLMEEPYKSTEGDKAYKDWSQVPKLIKSLSAFLRENRFKRDLEDATDRYLNAVSIAYNPVFEKRKEIFDRLPTDDPEGYVENYENTQSQRYGQELMKEAGEMRKRFVEAGEAFKAKDSPGRKALQKEVNAVCSATLDKIKDSTDDPGFQHELVSLNVENELDHHQEYDFGRLSDNAVTTLNLKVFRWLDEEVERIARKAVEELEQNLTDKKVLKFLEDNRDSWEKADSYIRDYEENTLGKLQSVYIDACRGTFYTRLSEYNVVREIFEGMAEPSGLVEEDDFKDAGKNAAAIVAAKYEDALNNLGTTLEKRLFMLFNYHVGIAAKNLQGMTDKMAFELAKSTEDTESRLYIRALAEQYPLISQARELTGYLRELQQLKSL